jgi:LPS-assembly protein
MLPRHCIIEPATGRAATRRALIAWLAVWPAIAASAGICPETPPPKQRQGAAAAGLPVEISAREARMSPDGLNEFSGAVRLKRDGVEISADQLIYDKSTEEARAHGNVTLRNESGDSFSSPEIQMRLDTHTGHMKSVTYEIAQTHGRGDAEHVEFESPTLTRLSNLRFTTCVLGQDDWFLKARDLELDTETDTGSARHATISFFGAPIFYWPYLRFPISDARRSGFLFPHFGYSSDHGGELAVPYYWNIAPNYDATFTPRLLSKRGMQLQNEFRYLGRHSEGKLLFEALPDDRLADDDRAAGSYKHAQTLNPRWSAHIDYNRVSDKNYLDDFGNSIDVTSRTHLTETADIGYRGNVWQFTARASGFQTLDATIPQTNRPYARTPQLILNANPRSDPNSPKLQFESELVYFQREENVKGGRVNLHPAISWPLRNSYAFFTPKAGIQHIAYRLSDTTSDETPQITSGIYSLDSGLFFDRDTSWGNRPYTQTLEPRLFYVFIPHTEQDDFPVFDTAEPDFSFLNLFRENRFLGGDRIGDTNQATLALTTRLFDDADGIERMRASIGRIYYFDDRRVNIPEGTLTTQASDLVGEAEARLVGNWYFRANVQRNEELDQVRKGSLYFQYQPAKDRIFNLGYRFIRNDLQESDVSTEWPVGGRWTFRARSLYSLRDSHNLDSYAGFEYNACCWALRVFARRRVSQTGEQKNSILAQLELTGLSRSGSVPDSPLLQGLFFRPESRDSEKSPLAR